MTDVPTSTTPAAEESTTTPTSEHGHPTHLNGRFWFNFQKAAQQAIADFPERTHKLLFLDGDDCRPLTPGSKDLIPEIVATTLPSSSIEPAKSLAAHAADRLANQYPAPAWVIRVNESDEGYMLYRRDRRPYRPSRLKSDDQATFDHELGHIVVNEGCSLYPQLAESAADAFALIRYIQRFCRTSNLAGFCGEAAGEFFAGH